MFWAKIHNRQKYIIWYIETVCSEQILLPCTICIQWICKQKTKKHIGGHLLSFYSPGTSAIFVKNTFL